MEYVSANFYSHYEQYNYVQHFNFRGVLLYTFVKGCYPFGGKDQVLNNHLWHYENLQLGSGQTEGTELMDIIKMHLL